MSSNLYVDGQLHVYFAINLFLKGMPQEKKKTETESRYTLLSIRSDTPPAETHSDDETGPKNYASFLRYCIHNVPT